MEKIIFSIPSELKDEFQIKTIKEKTDMTSVLVSLVKEYLKR